MILIFGGAFQGKLEYAKEKYDIKSVYDCGSARGQETGDFAGIEPDFSADVICSLEKFVLECVNRNCEAADFFRENREKWQDKILIMTDVSQGIVPTDAKLRAFREMNGRLMLYLAGEADEVVRVFCGIGKKVK